MICLFCGQKIGREFPVPIRELSMTPIVPYIKGVTENKLGLTVLTDRICCQDCYHKILQNEFKIIEEAGRMPENAK